MRFTLNLEFKELTLGTSLSNFLNDFNNGEMVYSKDKSIVYQLEKYILNLPFKSRISFSFIEEILIAITIGPTLENLNSPNYDVNQSFKIYNNALIKMYGSPNKVKKIFETKNVWKFDDAILEHFLLDRFGIQEILSIKLV